MQIKDRFLDKKVLAQALLPQKLVQNDLEMAEFIAEKGELVQFSSGETILKQGGFEQDVFFIILGQASLTVHGSTFKYVRSAGVSVGEMSAIDPTQPRSATLTAIEDTVTVKLTVEVFSDLVAKYPKIYQLLAVDLSQRLNQRNDLIDRQNEKPNLFIISTVEAIHIAREIKAQLDHDNVEVTIWSDTTVFDSGDYTIEALERAVKSSDFGLAILQDDDVVISRGEEHRGPRDNVIFELGLFMGLLTRRRTFIALERGVEQKLASDLKGLTPIEYKRKANDQPDVSNLVHKLRTKIESLGIRNKLEDC